MPAVAKCPHCGLEMDVPRSLRGMEVECPGCLKPFHPDERPPVTDSPPPLADQPPPLPSVGVATCPRCGLDMDIPADLHGQEIECPACVKIFVPGMVDPAPPPLPRLDLPVVHSSRNRRRRRRDEDYDDDRIDDDDYYRPTPAERRETAMARLRPAAIALLVIAIIRLLINGTFAVAGGFGLFQNANPGTLVMVAVMAVIFAGCSLQAYGAWLMLNARSYGLGLTAGIICLIPDCCCYSWVLWVGFAVWAIVVINDSDVRWLIRERQKEEAEMERPAG